MLVKQHSSVTVSAVAVAVLLWCGSGGLQFVSGQYACEALNATSACYGVLNYAAITVPTGYCQADIDLNLSQDATISAMLLSSAGTACQSAFAKLRCARFYSECPPTALPDTPLCSAACVEVDTACGGLVPLLEAAGVYNRTTYCGTAPCVAPTYKAVITPIAPPACAPYPADGICSPFVNYTVYTPAGTTHAAVEAIVNAKSFVFAVAPKPTCRDLLARFICSAAFPPCSYPLSAFAPGLPFPQLPCYSVCHDVLAACGAVLTAQFGINCNSTTPTARLCNGFDKSPVRIDYPDTSTEWGMFGAVPIVTACSRNTAAIGKAAPFTCPYPTVVPDDDTAETIVGGSCSLPCPSFIFSESDYDGFQAMMETVAPLSLIADIYLCLSFYFMPKRDREKKVKIMCFIFGVTIVGFIYFLRIIGYRANGDGQMSLQCKDNSQVASQSDGGYCVFEGTLLLFFALTTCFWWCVQAIDLWLNVTFNAARWPSDRVFKKELLMHIMAWGYPLLMVIIALSTKQIGGSTVGTPWCFIQDDNYLWGLFYGPIGTCFLVGTLAMGHIIFTICQTAKTAKEIRRSSAMGAGLTVKNESSRADYARPLMFILIFFCVWGLVFANRIYLYQIQDGVAADLTAWVDCVLTKAPLGAVCKGRPDSGPAFALFTDLLLVGCGIWSGIIFGTTPEFYRIWSGVLCGAERESSGSTPMTPRGSTPLVVCACGDDDPFQPNTYFILRCCSQKRGSGRNMSLKPGSPNSPQSTTAGAGAGGGNRASIRLPPGSVTATPAPSTTATTPTLTADAAQPAVSTAGGSGSGGGGGGGGGSTSLGDIQLVAIGGTETGAHATAPSTAPDPVAAAAMAAAQSAAAAPLTPPLNPDSATVTVAIDTTIGASPGGQPLSPGADAPLLTTAVPPTTDTATPPVGEA